MVEVCEALRPLRGLRATSRICGARTTACSEPRTTTATALPADGAASRAERIDRRLKIDPCAASASLRRPTTGCSCRSRRSGSTTFTLSPRRRARSKGSSRRSPDTRRFSCSGATRRRPPPFVLRLRRFSREASRRDACPTPRATSSRSTSRKSMLPISARSSSGRRCRRRRSCRVSPPLSFAPDTSGFSPASPISKGGPRSGRCRDGASCGKRCRRGRSASRGRWRASIRARARADGTSSGGAARRCGILAPRGLTSSRRAIS